MEFFDIPFASICLKMTDIVNVFDMCLIFFEFLCFSVFFAFFICIVTDIRIIAYIRGRVLVLISNAAFHGEFVQRIISSNIRRPHKFKQRDSPASFV